MYWGERRKTKLNSAYSTNQIIYQRFFLGSLLCFIDNYPASDYVYTYFTCHTKSDIKSYPYFVIITQALVGT